MADTAEQGGGLFCKQRDGGGGQWSSTPLHQPAWTTYNSARIGIVGFGWSPKTAENKMGPDRRPLSSLSLPPLSPFPQKQYQLDLGPPPPRISHSEHQRAGGQFARPTCCTVCVWRRLVRCSPGSVVSVGDILRLAHPPPPARRPFGRSGHCDEVTRDTSDHWARRRWRFVPMIFLAKNWRRV